MTQTAQIIRFPSRTPARARRLVTLRELQELYGFSERWWRYRIAEGMPTHRWRGGLRFDLEQVERWLDVTGNGLGGSHGA